MSRRARLPIAAIAAGLLLNGVASLWARQLSDGQPRKWEVVADKSLSDFVSNGFELKSVAYETSSAGPQNDPDVHHFLQKEQIW